MFQNLFYTKLCIIVRIHLYFCSCLSGIRFWLQLTSYNQVCPAMICLMHLSSSAWKKVFTKCFINRNIAIGTSQLKSARQTIPLLVCVGHHGKWPSVNKSYRPAPKQSESVDISRKGSANSALAKLIAVNYIDNLVFEKGQLSSETPPPNRTP